MTDSLEGQFLIAMPNMDDGRFDHSVIYVCSHTEQGAMGLVLNQVARHLSFEDLLLQLNILNDENAIRLPTKIREMNVHKGGPVEMERGFVLHTNDYVLDRSTLEIDNGICLTATLEILKALAEGRGPEKAMLALGYSGWAPGQLESEIQANG
ncbi:MAG: YqgE/AlgH family protein, partial [Roseibium sp.]